MQLNAWDVPPNVPLENILPGSKVPFRINSVRRLIPDSQGQFWASAVRVFNGELFPQVMEGIGAVLGLELGLDQCGRASLVRANGGSPQMLSPSAFPLGLIQLENYQMLPMGTRKSIFWPFQATFS